MDRISGLGKVQCDGKADITRLKNDVLIAALRGCLIAMEEFHLDGMLEKEHDLAVMRARAEDLLGELVRRIKRR